MKFIPSLCLVILVSVQFASADLISQTCASTRFKDLCEKTLRSDPGSNTADIHGLVEIALKAVSPIIKTVQSEIARLQKSTSDNYTLACLRDCAENYDGASGEVARSFVSIKSRNYADLNVWISAAMADATSCEDGFNPGTSQLTTLYNNVEQLCSNVLAIANQAAGGAN